MRYREVAAKLTRLGCRELLRHGAGSHRKWLNPRTDKATVIPDWASKDLKQGTLRAVVRQLGLNWSDFESA